MYTIFRKVDVWSVGCLFPELADGRQSFEGVNEMDQLGLIVEVVGTPNGHSWHGFSAFPVKTEEWPRSLPSDYLRYEFLHRIGRRAVDLLESMLVANPAEGISASDTLQHSFFSGGI